MSKRNVHVVPERQQVGGPRAGKPTLLSNHRTQGAAEDAGRRVARQRESELVIHQPNGQIRDADSYGKDPNPPTDTKH